MRGGCVRRIEPSSRSLPRDLSWEKSRATAVDGVTGPTELSPECGGPCVGRSQVAVALSARHRLA